MTPNIVMDLPFPPSANHLWRAHTNNGTGKPRFYRDGHYVSWLQECDVLCMAAKWRRNAIKGRFRADIILDENRRRGHVDADNKIKPLLDFCQRAGLVEDDAYANGVSIEWGIAPTGCHVTLTAVLLEVDRSSQAARIRFQKLGQVNSHEVWVREAGESPNYNLRRPPRSE